jgi:hypothetical protein
MNRWLGIAVAVYLPHLLEEALMGMHDDPLIVAAFAPLSQLSARHATYLCFQIMLAVLLAVAYLVGRGGFGRTLVLSGIALALLGESHHLVRALWTLHYNPGLFTAAPMPVVGALLGRALWKARRAMELAP